MYVNGKAGPDRTGLSQPKPEQGSPLHFTCMCQNARAWLPSSTPPTVHFSKMTSFSRPSDPVNFQTLYMCWFMTYFNRGIIQGFHISVNKKCVRSFLTYACSGTCNKQNQTSREVSMVYCISQNNSKQLRQQRKEAWRVFCNTKWSHSLRNISSKIRAHLLIAVIKQLPCLILGFQLAQICLSNYDLSKNILMRQKHDIQMDNIIQLILVRWQFINDYLKDMKTHPLLVH